MKKYFKETTAKFFLLSWIIILGTLFSTLSIVRHTRFQSGGFDLGLFDQTVWKYAHFQSPYNTIKDRFILGDHFSPILALLAPLYWLWSDVRMLLIFQAFWLSFSTAGAYLLARKRQFSPLVSFNLAIIYSLFYGIQYAVFFDFHAVIIGAGLLPWIALFLEQRRKYLLWTSIVLLLLTKENMGLALVSLGLIYFWRRNFRRQAILMVVGGLAWSLLAAKVIRFFSPIGFQYWPQVLTNPLENIIELFNSQEKRQVWFYTLVSFSFLPILSPGAILAITFNLAQYFVTGPEFARMWSPFMHHRAILGPLVFLGTLPVLEKLKKKRKVVLALSFILVVSTFGQQYLFHFPLNKLSKHEFRQKEAWMIDNQELIKTVPSKASVATQQNLVPHLSQRDQIYLVWPRLHDFEEPFPCGQVSCWWLDFPDHPEYLVVDTRPHQWLTQILESNENFRAAIKNMETAGKITLVDQQNDAKLYQIHY